MKKHIYKISILVALMTFTFSCNKDELLEISPKTQLSGDSYNNEENLQAALFATYDVLQWHIVDGVHVYPVLFQGIRSDDYNAQQQNFWGFGSSFDRFPISVESQPVEKLWKKWYSGIGRANITIAKAEEFTGWTSDGLKDRVIAEAKTLRALYYFELVRSFGGVPLLTDAVESLNDLPALERATKAQIYTQIDADLEEAIPHLPLKSELSVNELGRIQKGTAQAILAKSKLYQQDWSASALYSEAVIKSGEYALEENFSANFSVDTENGAESILEIQFGDGFNRLGSWFESEAQLSNGSGMWQMSFPWMIDHYTSWGNMLPRGELKNLYADNDVRKKATFLCAGDDMNSPTLEAAGLSPLPDFVFGGWFPDKSLPAGVTEQDPNDFNMARKYFLTYEQVGDLAIVQQSPLNEKMIRYADVLLMHAEAGARGGNTTIDPASSLQQITDRAGIPAVAFNLENVKLERRKELATEGWNRFSDLMRYKELGEGYPGRLDLKGFQTGRDEYLPIPQAEINTIGSAVLVQNPGY